MKQLVVNMFNTNFMSAMKSRLLTKGNLIKTNLKR